MAKRRQEPSNPGPNSGPKRFEGYADQQKSQAEPTTRPSDEVETDVELRLANPNRVATNSAPSPTARRPATSGKTDWRGAPRAGRALHKTEPQEEPTADRSEDQDEPVAGRGRRRDSDKSRSFVARVAPLEIGDGGCVLQGWEGRLSLSGAVPGERVNVEVFERDRGYRQVNLLEIVERSPDRVRPPCVITELCGGCAFQEMAYTAQLEAKHVSLLQHLDGLCDPSQVGPVRGLTRSTGYRTRLLMPAAPRSTRPGDIELGFYRQHTNELIAATGCPVQHPLTLAVLAMVHQVLRASNMQASTTRRGDNGWLHGVSIRVDPAGESTELVLIGRTHKVPGGEVLVERLASLPTVNGVHLTTNPERSSYLYGEDFSPLAGSKRTIFHLGGETFHLSPGSFFQTSAEGAEKLVSTVLELLPEAFDCLADLYGGVGVFARLTRHRWRRAVVAESNPRAVEDLRHFLKHVGLKGLHVVNGRVEETLEHSLKHRPDVVLLDPPRGGCAPQAIQGLLEHDAPVLLYVACGLKAFVRDAALLIEGGYQLVRVESVDMFPHTSHLEVVARFER